MDNMKFVMILLICVLLTGCAFSNSSNDFVPKYSDDVVDSFMPAEENLGRTDMSENQSPDIKYNTNTTNDGVFEYSLRDGLVTIIDVCKDNDTYIIPDFIENYPVVSIASNAFYNSACTNVVLPQNLKIIENAAFYRCYYLTRVYIPENVSIIGENPFFRCSSLKNITVCEKNEHFCDIEGVLFDKTGKILFAYPEGREDIKYIIPHGTTTIKEVAFGYNPSFEELIIPSTVIVFPDSNLFIYSDDKTICACENLAAEEYANIYGLRCIIIELSDIPSIQ